MNPGAFFSPDYATARQRFRDAAQLAGGRLWQHPIGTAGHTVDFARFGPDSAERLLILSSGLHGVEGFFGSAVQLAYLSELHSKMPPSVGVLLIHALNPIGFDHRRRFNEENIDLNRNFLEASQFEKLREESLSSLYARLDGYLNPKSPPGRFDGFSLTAIWLILRYGFSQLKRSLPIGQYAFPKGLFFGGFKPAASTRLVMEHLAEWVGPVQRVLHLDWHTGLGDWATFKLLCTRQRNDPVAQRAISLFGEWVETREGETSYQARGDISEWCMGHSPVQDYLCLCAEFGSYLNVQTLKKLRKENRAEHYSPVGSEIQEQAKRELLEAFVPASEEWRQRVIEQSLEIIQRGLTNWASVPIS
jgi:hypothetical protein